MYFSYKDLLNNENAQILISSEFWTVKAYITSEIRFNARTNWGLTSSKGENLVNSLYSQGTSVANMVAGGVGMGGSIQSRQFKTGASTMTNWTGTEPFNIPIDLVFLATNPEDDVRDPVRYLTDGVFPNFGKTLFTGKEKPSWITTMTAPLGYQRGNYENPKGVVQLQIGRWFKTTPIFVIMDTDFTFSKETKKDGLPLYCTGNIRFQAYRDVSVKEVRSWLSNPLSARRTSKFVLPSSKDTLEKPNWDEIAAVEEDLDSVYQERLGTNHYEQEEGVL